jgi:pyridinium-3,5-biscarboxylic acid mononucleotide sulfurtransferase
VPSASPEVADALLGAEAEAFAQLARAITVHGALVVAFSGGADSALLGFVATAVLGREAVLCATAASPSLASDDLAAAETLATSWGLRHTVVSTHELDDPKYRQNDLDRCFHCKAALMEALAPIAAAEGAVVALGVNRDDLGEHRPGQDAARERGAVFPLLAAGLTKAAVRSLSRALGLSTWDKPANACLSSRVPQGTPVSIGLLGQVEAAEAALRQLGFGQLRVRHHGGIARIELPPEAFGVAVARHDEIVDAVRAAGYRYVTLDLAGFSSGNLVRTALDEASSFRTTGL